MRLTLAILGWEVDLSLAPSDATIAAPDGASLDGGTTASYSVGFMYDYGTPEDVPLPQRTPAWDEPEE